MTLQGLKSLMSQTRSNLCPTGLKLPRWHNILTSFHCVLLHNAVLHHYTMSNTFDNIGNMTTTKQTFYPKINYRVAAV